MIKIINNSFINKDKIFVYQMGKVASTAIIDALEQKGVKCSHLHSVRGDISYRQIKCDITKPNVFIRLKKAMLGAYKKVLLNIPNKTCKIITLVRNPVSRDISMMFQLGHKLIYEYIMSNKGSNRIDKDSLEVWTDIHKNYFDEYYSLNWFNEEFKKVTGVDVYKYEFDKSLGYKRIKEKHYDILVLKYEKLNDLSEVISEFVGADILMKQSNTSVGKWYSAMYNDYKRNRKFDQNYLIKEYSSMYVKHFYSDEEIKAFVEELK